MVGLSQSLASSQSRITAGGLRVPYWLPLATPDVAVTKPHRGHNFPEVPLIIFCLVCSSASNALGW